MRLERTIAEEIEDEWWALWRRDPAATPFQSPAWLIPWRRHFSDGDDVVLALRGESGRLLALLPFFRLEGRLLLWGAGTSDWLGGLFDPSLDPQALSHALASLSEPLDLFQLPEVSPLLAAPLPAGWSERRGFSAPCVLLALPASPGKSMRQNLRTCRRRVEKAGGVIARGDAACLDALAELHTRRWRQGGEAGIFADPRMLAWQREALPALEAAGLLRLHVLRIEGRIAAALYLLAARDRAYYYIGGFDPAHAGLSVGTVLLGHAIAEAEREGLRSFDFLRGSETYKYRWGAADRPSHARYLSPPAYADRRI